VAGLDRETLEMEVEIESDPPPTADVTLVLAVPRPKVLNRVIASAASLGIKHIVLVNAWRVEKSYWSSPRMAPDKLREQAILGLEQAKDTILPVIEVRRLFRPFVEEELPERARGTLALAGHPAATEACPRAVAQPVTLAIGPEGGFIEAEIASLTRAGFTPVSLGPRVLRVETILPVMMGRLRN
jgi:RsmE family RNA methyltransferase